MNNSLRPPIVKLFIADDPFLLGRKNFTANSFSFLLFPPKTVISPAFSSVFFLLLPPKLISKSYLILPPFLKNKTSQWRCFVLFRPQPDTSIRYLYYKHIFLTCQITKIS